MTALLLIVYHIQYSSVLSLFIAILLHLPSFIILIIKCMLWDF